MKHIILAQSKVTANALHICRQLILGEDLVGTTLTADDVIFEPARMAQEGGVPAYRHLVRRIEDACQFDRELGRYDSTVVLVDCVDPWQLSVVGEAVTWEKLIAMLVLTFPEVHWVFGVLRGTLFDQEDRFLPSRSHTLPSLREARQSWLFDLSGLRDWVRKRTSESLTARYANISATGDASYLPRRQETALALDEETAYSYLNAYTAYRFGFRAAPIYTFTLAKEFLHKRCGHDGSGVDGSHHNESINAWPPRIIFEDIYLNFADGILGLSQLYRDPEGKGEGRGRAEELPLVEEIPYRLFMSSGQRLHGDAEKHEKNKAYISAQRTLGKSIKVLAKPHAGIFKLWRQTGLARSLCKGLAAGFAWPPETSRGTDRPHDHSSPGPLLVVAETLIYRAEALLRSGVASVEPAVRGAVLATDALELLGGRTPTLSLQALRLKHQFEVLAESQFVGVAHHFEINERLEDIRKEVTHISRWFGRRQRGSAALDGEMQVLLDLVRVLRNSGQFNEELVLMNRMRYIHHTLWMHQRPWRLVMKPLLRYVEFLLGSFPRFVLSLMAWVFILAGLFWIATSAPAGIAAGNPGTGGMRAAISLALESFVGKGLPSHINVFKDSLYVLATIAGLLHIGAFVSLLYSTVTRK